MTRSVVSWMCLVIAMVAVGCTKSPPSPSKAPAGKDTGPQAPVAAPATQDRPETVPAAAADQKPATDVAAGNVPGGAAKPDMTPPADVTPPAPKLPFEDLVAALGNDRATQVYRQIEQQLAQNPKDVMGRLQLASLLNSVGLNLANTGNREKGLEAFRAALEQANAVTIDPQQPWPEGADAMLSGVYYNGACAQSLDGKPEDAKATLQKAIELGFSDVDTLRNDADLAAVRALPGFDQQLVEWEKLIAELLVKQAQEVLASNESFPFDFALTDLSGQSISLAGYQGKVLIVDIWGTWCGPCKMEIPSFVKLQNEYGPQGFQMVGLNYENEPDDAAKKDTVTKFVQEYGINYPCALGTEAIQQQVPDFRGFPTTLFIDRTGKVRAMAVGTHEYAFLEAIVKILLAEPAPPPAAPTDTPPAAPAETAPPAAPTDTPPTDAPPAAPTDAPPTDAPPTEPGK